MTVPWILYAGAAAQGLPLIAAVTRGRSLTTPRKWVLVWCASLVATNLAARLLALQNQNNHWLNYLTIPITDGLVLWALALWQRSPRATAVLRVLVPLLWVVWLGMVLLFEDTRTFSLLAEPFAGLVVMGGALYTLISRTSQESGNLLRQDWLWVGIGVALYSGSAVALPPMANWLVARYPELVVRAYEWKAGIEIVAFLAIARGVLCPTTSEQSIGAAAPASPPLVASSPTSSSGG